MCNSVRDACIKKRIEVRHYHIDLNFLPIDVTLQENEWLYIVNYYGQLDNTVLSELKRKYKRVIIDNAQAYFQMPMPEVDTLYTCRKFFGVADGAFLYTDAILNEELERDESYERMHFLLGRFERTASEFHSEYIENNQFFMSEATKSMSKLTENLLRGIEYNVIKEKRTQNFKFLHEALHKVNGLKLSVPQGSFMYPLYINNGLEIRKNY